MNFIPAETEIGGGGGFNVVVCNLEIAASTMTRNLAPILRGVVFIPAKAKVGGS